MEFTTQLKDRDIVITGKGEEDLTAEVLVHWTVDIEYRDWGVKSISAYVTHVGVTIMDEDDNETYPELVIDSNIEVEDDMIQVTDAYIDLKEKTISIS